MLLLLPTDTCYGLAGEFTEQDYHEIYRLKGRDFQKQLAFLVEDYADMKKYIEISDEQIDFLRTYPYPWSFLGKRICTLPTWMDGDSYQMLSLRVAKVCLPIESEKYEIHNGFPYFLTSANHSGERESHTLAEATEYFPGISGYDGGVCNHPPSDIFSLDTIGELTYLRQNYKKTPNE